MVSKSKNEKINILQVYLFTSNRNYQGFKLEKE